MRRARARAAVLSSLVLTVGCAAAPAMPDPPPSHPASPDAPAAPQPPPSRTLAHDKVSPQPRPLQPGAGNGAERMPAMGGHGGKR